MRPPQHPHPPRLPAPLLEPGVWIPKDSHCQVWDWFSPDAIECGMNPCTNRGVLKAMKDAFLNEIKQRCASGFSGTFLFFLGALLGFAATLALAFAFAFAFGAFIALTLAFGEALAWAI